MTIDEWEEVAGKGTSGDMVFDILRDWKNLNEQIKSLSEHHIPFYGYGDNQAACEMSDRLKKISELV